MTTLIQSCSQLRAGLQKVKVANQTRQEISALQDRMREWGQRVSTRQSLLDKTRIVDPSLLQREDIKQVDQGVLSLAEQSRRLLEDGGNVQDLATDSLWTRLNNAAESANQLLREASCEQWRQFVESLGHIDSAAVLEGRMLKTPSNEAILTKYREHYAKYQSAVRVELPSSASARLDLTSTVANLQELREQLKGSAPEAVRVFLKAIENGGASLELLTPEVFEWIRENDDQNRFVVKPRNSQTWR